MGKVAIVTDSSGFIPQDIVEQYHISVAPQILIWGEETFQDGVDIQPTEFYQRLSNSKVIPTTAQATIASFQDIFTSLLNQDYDILAILVSNELSGTVDSAIQARELVGNSKIEIIDSRTISMALGFQVIETAKAAAEGASLEECKALVESTKENVGIIFTVDTLEFLHRGGRIGGGSRFLGTALKIKPILEVANGRIEALERVRTRKKSWLRIIEIVEERTKGQSPIYLAALHANAKLDAEQLISLVSNRINSSETIISELSPIVGTHVGPGTIGLAYFYGV